MLNWDFHEGFISPFLIFTSPMWIYLTIAGIIWLVGGDELLHEVTPSDKDTVSNDAVIIELTPTVALIETQPIIQEPKRPLLVTRVDSESGRMTIELSDGMKAVFVVALIVCCFAVVMGYRVTARLIQKEDGGKSNV